MEEMTMSTQEEIENIGEDNALQIYEPGLLSLQAEVKDYPIYLQELAALPISDEEKVAQLSLFESGHMCKFDRYLNKEVEVLGAIIFYKPPYVSQKQILDNNGKVLCEPGQLAPGYEQIRLLVNDWDEDGLPYVVGCSIGSLGNHLWAIVKLYGWFLWESPIVYRFWRDERTGGFRLTNISYAKQVRSRFAKGEKK